MEWLCIGIPVLALLVFIGNEWAKGEAKKQYEASLAKLKANPNNADLRAQTLALGRVYADKTRNGQGVAIFDEMAIKNDIDAATAGAARITNQPQPAAYASATAGSDTESRLRKLNSLLAQQFITQDEFDRRRQAILDEI